MMNGNLSLESSELTGEELRSYSAAFERALESCDAEGRSSEIVPLSKVLNILRRLDLNLEELTELINAVEHTDGLDRAGFYALFRLAGHVSQGELVDTSLIHIQAPVPAALLFHGSPRSKLRTVNPISTSNPPQRHRSLTSPTPNNNTEIERARSLSHNPSNKNPFRRFTTQSPSPHETPNKIDHDTFVKMVTARISNAIQPSFATESVKQQGKSTSRSSSTRRRPPTPPIRSPQPVIIPSVIPPASRNQISQSPGRSQAPVPPHNRHRSSEKVAVSNSQLPISIPFSKRTSTAAPLPPPRRSPYLDTSAISPASDLAAQLADLQKDVDNYRTRYKSPERV
ncbi:hypothetical protein NEOLI_002556 [Neolecta irregularis DAH-3]|uniref:Uncharacterized protein n=1 Tax=Neolecta irregularis (strain DAH-3) TaxID=1198029 RepID=A0A1U7LJF6_NEOID|nr:hypothetical protein NEOLI_002556 [Neolecta irregularis DAH-3]|eukprot:OLL22682.1 hypothetical protein NEOLI_002556 [Neolecta irregularis DAH-3]